MNFLKNNLFAGETMKTDNYINLDQFPEAINSQFSTQKNKQILKFQHNFQHSQDSDEITVPGISHMSKKISKERHNGILTIEKPKFAEIRATENHITSAVSSTNSSSSKGYNIPGYKENQSKIFPKSTEEIPFLTSNLPADKNTKTNQQFKHSESKEEDKNINDFVNFIMNRKDKLKQSTDMLQPPSLPTLPILTQQHSSNNEIDRSLGFRKNQTMHFHESTKPPYRKPFDNQNYQPFHSNNNNFVRNSANFRNSRPYSQNSIENHSVNHSFHQKEYPIAEKMSRRNENSSRDQQNEYNFQKQNHQPQIWEERQNGMESNKMYNNKFTKRNNNPSEWPKSNFQSNILSTQREEKMQNSVANFLNRGNESFFAVNELKKAQEQTSSNEKISSTSILNTDIDISEPGKMTPITKSLRISFSNYTDLSFTLQNNLENIGNKLTDDRRTFQELNEQITELLKHSRDEVVKKEF